MWKSGGLPSPPVVSSLMKKRLKTILKLFVCLVSDSKLIQWLMQKHRMIPYQTI
jgi:hypothetical protein